ncbi:MAG TPA: hypothetical protein VF623_03655 [Segetibacter sp.]|jgi:predicted transcriptional regulator
MNTIEKRKKLHEYIDNSNEEVVDSLYSYLQTPKSSHVDFVRNYNSEIDEAMARIDKGFFTSHENVEKEAEQW